jgi:hypothetical protein
MAVLMGSNDATRRPNKQLQRWFDKSGYSKQGLAQEITRRARAAGHRHVSPDGSRVRRWLTEGQHPREPVPKIVAEVLSERVGVLLTPEDLDLAVDRSSGTPDLVPWGVQSTLTALGRASREAMLRQIAAQPDVAAYGLSPEELLAQLQPWLHARPDPLPTAAAGSGVSLGMADVRRLEAVTEIFRQLDDTCGGGLARSAIAGQVAWASDLVADGTYTEPVGRALFAALADLCGIAGWMSHDSGVTSDAIRYLVLGVHAAKESGDRNLGAHLLQCLSRVYGYIGSPAAGLEFVTLALYGSRETATPRISAGLHALEGRFNALLGREQQCRRSYGMVQESSQCDSVFPEPAYLAYLDTAELRSSMGEGWLFLGQATGNRKHVILAVGLLESALTTRASHRLRSRAFDTIALARAHLAMGHPEAAASLLDVNFTDLIASARITTRLRDVLSESLPFADVPAISAVRDLISRGGSRES